jgi:hypothetical protein
VNVVASQLSGRRLLSLLALVLVVGLSYRLVGQHVLPESAQMLANLGVMVGLVVLLVRWGVLPADLGLRHRFLARGVTTGLVIALVAAVVIGIGLFIPVTRDALAGGAGAVAGGATLLWSSPALHAYATLGILLATALPEELLFRGALHGLLSKRLALPLAVAVNGVLFGLWHLPMALGWLSGTATTAAAGGFGLVGLALLTVVFTGVAGVFFTLLRHWTQSLAAPVLAHWGVNAAAVLGASAAARLVIS